MYSLYELRHNTVEARNGFRISACPVRMHRHIELLLAESDGMVVRINGRVYTLNRGDMYVIFPNVPHGIESETGVGTVVFIAPDICRIYRQELIGHGPENPVIPRERCPEAVLQLISRMAQMYCDGAGRDQRVLAGYAGALVGEVLSVLKLKPREADDNLLESLASYILENYTGQITLRETAKALNYSQCYISRLILSAFGCNFRSLINSYRVALAENLLLTEEESILEICATCGFQNQSTFNRVFRQQTGMTPRQYRQQRPQPAQIPKLYIR